VKQDAQYALILESIAEINARLKILDEANARLEAAAEHQLELLAILVTRQEQMAGVRTESPGRQTQMTHQKPDRSSSRTDGGAQMGGAQASRIIDDNYEYSRDTHPALFKVVDLLEKDGRARTLSVRQLAHETGVSKSWCAIAKRHVLREESVH
jgi:hypothetical protein